MADMQFRIPHAYQDAVVRCVLPVCIAAGRIAFAFDTAAGQTLRLSVSVEQAAWLAGCLSQCMSEAAGAQSSGASMVPSLPVPVPTAADVMPATIAEAKKAVSLARARVLMAGEEMAVCEEVMPEGADPDKWAKAQAIKARMAAASAQVRERNPGLEQVASITVVLHKSGQVSLSSERGGRPDSSSSPFDQALLGQRVQQLAQELREILLYGVRL